MLRNFLVLMLLGFLVGLSDVAAQNWHVRYDSLLSQGKSFDTKNQYNRAIPFFEQAYALAGRVSDTTLIVEAGLALGTSKANNGQAQEGLKHFLLLDGSYGSTSLPRNTRALIKNQIGWAYYNFLGEYASAILYLKEGLDIADPLTDSSNVATLARNLGNSFLYVGKYDTALSYTKLAIEYNPKKERLRLGLAYRNTYVAYLFLGAYSAAKPYLLNSCDIANQVGDNSLLNDCYFFLGEHYSRENNYNRAITSYQKGLAIAEQINDLENIARFYRLLGLVYLEIEDPVRALNYFNRSLNYYETTGNKVQATEIRVQIAACFKKTGDVDRAEEQLLEALAFYSGGDFPYLEGSTLISLANLTIETGNEKRGLWYLDQSYKIGEASNNFWIKENTQARYLELSDSLYSPADKLSLSKRIYSSSLRLPLDQQLTATINLSRAYEAMGSDSAFFYAEQSFKEIEKKRLSFSGGTLKAGLFADYASYYNEVGSWYASHKKNYSRAFELIEAAKARALLDELAEANEEELLKLNEATQIELLQLQKKVDQLYRRRDGISDNAEFQRLSDEISDAQFDYEAKLEEIRRSQPAWNSFLYPKTLSLKKVRDLCDSKTAIIEYAFSDDQLLIFFITEDRVYYYESPVDKKIKETLTSLINGYRDALIGLEDPSVLSEKSAALYSVLISPAEKHLEDFTNLVIIPDGPLSALPFEALRKNNRYFIQDYAIKYLPSVSVFNLIQSPHRSTKMPLLALAGTGFEDGDGTTGSRTQEDFAALPYALIEVDSIAADFETSTVLKNQQVTEAALKSMNLGQYKYLHFATHGNIDEVSPSQSGLILSKKQETEGLFGEDGYLNASEISHLNLNADMVVLSACNTAMGKVLSGEGLLGLQRSFLAAGSSSVVASLWNIYDRSTPLFMDSFYTKLIEYEKDEIGIFSKFLIWADLYEPELVDYKTIALRDAKLEMLEHPYYNHPAHWAPFIITGK